MKKIYLLLLLMLFAAPAVKAVSSISRTEVVTQVILTRHRPGSTKPKLPEQNPLVLYCVASDTPCCIMISASKDVDGSVEITSFSTGETTVFDESLSSDPQVFPLCTTGAYTITITVENGDFYTGDFVI